MAVGIGLAVLASLCFAAGSLVEKRAVDKMAPFTLGNIRAAIGALSLSKWWLIGAAISLIGLPIQIVAYSRTAISIVQSIGVAGLVVLVAASGFVLRERFGRRELIGLAFAVCSLVLVCLSLTKQSDVAGIHGSVRTTLVTSGVTLLAVAVVVATRVLQKDHSGFVYGCVAGLLYGVSGLGAKGLSTLIAQYGVLGSLLHSLRSPFLYLFLGSWALGLAVFQAGIQRCRVGVVGSLAGVVASAFVVATGMVAFGEHLPSDPALRVLRVVGFAGILLGSALVGWRGSLLSPTQQVVVSAEVDDPMSPIR